MKTEDEIKRYVARIEQIMHRFNSMREAYLQMDLLDVVRGGHAVASLTATCNALNWALGTSTREALNAWHDEHGSTDEERANSCTLEEYIDETEQWINRIYEESNRAVRGRR